VPQWLSIQKFAVPAVPVPTESSCASCSTLLKTMFRSIVLLLDATSARIPSRPLRQTTFD